MSRAGLSITHDPQASGAPGVSAAHGSPGIQVLARLGPPGFARVCQSEGQSLAGWGSGTLCTFVCNACHFSWVCPCRCHWSVMERGSRPSSSLPRGLYSPFANH